MYQRGAKISRCSSGLNCVTSTGWHLRKISYFLEERQYKPCVAEEYNVQTMLMESQKEACFKELLLLVNFNFGLHSFIIIICEEGLSLRSDDGTA